MIRKLARRLQAEASAREGRNHERAALVVPGRRLVAFGHFLGAVTDGAFPRANEWHAVALASAEHLRRANWTRIIKEV